MIASILFLVHFILIGQVSARSGCDLSVATDLSTWQCLKNQENITYTLIRTYRSVGEMDENAPTSIKLAAEVGITDIGGYMFPCIPSSSYSVTHNITCDDPKAQVDKTILYLRKHGIDINSESSANSINRMWIDVEDEVPSKYYDSDPAVNQKFLAAMVDDLKALNVPIGIYTTSTYWKNIMGNVLGYSDFPLWYPRFDGIADMNIFGPDGTQSFGGWNEVNIKQFAGDSNLCGISQVDSDYMEEI